MSSSNDADTRRRYAADVKIEVTIAQVREEVAALHTQLVRHGHIRSIGGAVSARVPGTELFVLSVSGSASDDVAPQNTALCDLGAHVVPNTPGSEYASADQVAAHAHVYLRMEQVGGIVHSHAPYAFAWSTQGRELPCVLGVIADEFGGPIPAAEPEGARLEKLGVGVVSAVTGTRSPAVFVRGNGAFALGPTAQRAAGVARIVDDVARIVHLAQQRAELDALSPDVIDLRYEHRLLESASTTADRR